MEKTVKDSQSPAASYERTGCEDCLKTRSNRLVNKLSTSTSSKSCKPVEVKQSEDQSGEQARENSIQSRHI